MRRLLLAIVAPLVLIGLLVAAAPAGSAGTAGAVGGAGGGSAGARLGQPLSAQAAAARPDSVCQPDGAGCTQAGTYPNPDGLINSDYTGFAVDWTSSVVQPYSSGVPLWWTANITYTNVTSGTLVLGCPGSWSDPSNVWEWMSGGSGDDGGVAASSTNCSLNPGQAVPVPPGGTFLATATFHNVPWPGSDVFIQWGDAGNSPAVNPFPSAPRTAPLAACTFAGVKACQSLDPLVKQDLYYYGDVSSCVFEWSVNWGDGTKMPDITEAGPPDGYVFLADHAYQRQGTFTVTVTGRLLSGDCTVTDGSERFTMLAYAALGDSYSAGVGAGNYLAASKGPVACWRSYDAYPALVATALGDQPAAADPPFAFVACNGAVMADFEQSQSLPRPDKEAPPQLDVVRQSAGTVGLVTFTISGNDADFGPIMQYCATRLSFQESCQAKYGPTLAHDLAKIALELPILLLDFDKARALVPAAKIVVVGYPQFFDPAWFRPKAKTPACKTGVGSITFLKSDMNWIDQSIRKLDQVMSDAAAGLGFTYVNDATAFSGGHYLCEPKPDLHAAIVSGDYFMSFHPTATGQRAIAADVEQALGIG